MIELEKINTTCFDKKVNLIIEPIFLFFLVTLIVLNYLLHLI